jgi:hypothetical protein
VSKKSVQSTLNSSSQPASTEQAAHSRPEDDRSSSGLPARLFPFALLLAMECIFLLLAAALPLYGLWFHTSLSTQFGQWVLLPARLLFPGWQLNPMIFHPDGVQPPPIGLSWQATALLGGIFALLLPIYLLALRSLPQRISRRYIVASVLLFGLTCAFIPMVTSPDVFSYIIYARMGAIYHLNPLTTLPTAIPHDPAYPQLYWTDQPSAYGPTWAIITCALQWLLALVGLTTLAPMVLALRLLGLAAHVCSVLLVWSISGHMQTALGKDALQQHNRRVLATLAFAWNPLLIFEACVNAHNDTIVLLLVLLALWFLVRPLSSAHITRSYAVVALLLALATCLKVNVALLMPGLLLYLWTRSDRLRMIGATLATYIATIVLLYAPFWQHGALLAVLHTNPGTARAINTLPDFLSHLYNSLAQLLGAPPAADVGSPAETFARLLSMALFILAYGLLCWRSIARQGGIHSQFQLLRWMTIAWLLYGFLGAPWFWPWYLVVFFGLFALVEAVDNADWQERAFFGFLRLPLAARLLAWSMLSLYCLYTWAPYASFIPWLPTFRWAYLRGAWAWLVPLPAISLLSLMRQKARSLRTDPVAENRTL